MVVEESGADLRRACFFFGERIKGLRRDGLAVDSIDDRQWCEMFTFCAAYPVVWEAWRDLVEWMISQGDGSLLLEAEIAGFGKPPETWREQTSEIAAKVLPEREDGREAPWLRHTLGIVMDELRGKVPASEVESLIEDLSAKDPANC